MVMGGVSWMGGNQELVRPTTATWFKMEDVCILCNVIEISFIKISNQKKEEYFLAFWNSKWHTPTVLEGFKCESENENNERKMR